MQKLYLSIKPYVNPRVFSMAVLGIPYGMMFALAVHQIQAWLSDEGAAPSVVSCFSIVSLPYTLKFFWAPLINMIHIPWLHRLGPRRSWLIFSHICLIILLNLVAFSNPSHNVVYVAILALLLAIFSGIQDIVVDAYRIEVLKQEHAGPGIGMLTAGYRVGSFAATFGTLMIADRYSWTTAYSFMSVFISLGILAALMNPEPENFVLKEPVFEEEKAKKKRGIFLEKFFQAFLFKHFIPPMREFFSRKGCFYIVLFILSYRLADAFISTIAYPFYFSIGYTKAEIADIIKFFGVLPTLMGGLIGGALSVRLNVFHGLLFAGALHSLSHIMLIVLSYIGYAPTFLYYTIFFENITGGIATAIFLLYLSREAHPKYIPTQYAFFTSLWSSATVLASIGGRIVEWMGSLWPLYYTFCFLLSLPPLFLISKLKKFRMANPGGLSKE